jgi:oxygen-dependent protoporphyrinogen oxidase
MSKHVVVIGGGMAGTAAAYRLTQLGYRVTIVEKNGRLGGRIHSKQTDGTSFEMGAGFISNIYTNIQHFIVTNDLAEKLYRQHGTSGIVIDGRPVMATVRNILSNKLLSWPAKLQIVRIVAKVIAGWRRLDVHAMWKAAKYDTVSAADMMPGKSGRELLGRLVEPLLDGYFYWSSERTSQAMLMCLGKAGFRKVTYKMQGGLQQLPEKAAEGSTVLLSSVVESVRRGKGGTYTVRLSGKQEEASLQADGIVCATTASAVSRIFPDLQPRQRDFFAAISYSSTAVVVSTYAKNMLLKDVAIGYPRAEKNLVTTVTVSPEPVGSSLKLGTVKIFASGKVGVELCKQTDDVATSRLIASAVDLYPTIMHDGARAISTTLQKWPEAIPVFEAGYFQRLKTFADGGIEDQAQAVTFAGDYIGGPFIEGAFTSGLQAAERLDSRLT